MTCASISLMLPTQYMVYDPEKYKSILDYLWHFVDSFNWASVMVIGVYFGATLSWYLSARKTFIGPKPDATLLTDESAGDEKEADDGIEDETRPLLARSQSRV